MAVIRDLAAAGTATSSGTGHSARARATWVRACRAGPALYLICGHSSLKWRLTMRGPRGLS